MICGVDNSAPCWLGTTRWSISSPTAYTCWMAQPLSRPTVGEGAPLARLRLPPAACPTAVTEAETISSRWFSFCFPGHRAASGGKSCMSALVEIAEEHEVQE